MKRNALITGANRGLGFAIARELATLGHSVFLGSRDLKAGEEAADILSRPGLDITPIQLDLTKAASIDSAIAAICGSGLSIDMLVNNAGVLLETPLLDLTDEEILDSVSVHITGPIRLMRAIVPSMVTHGYGRIVNVSSGWGSFAEGLGGPGAYGVTKAGLNALTVRLSEELPGTIKVNAMCPGWVRTRMGGRNAPRTPESAADTAVWLATLPDDGPTGGFFRDRKSIPW